MSHQLRLPLQTVAELNAQANAQVFEDVNEMQRRVPALFAKTAHPRMSEMYSFTNTYDVVLALHNRGYRVSSISGGASLYAKLMVRMRNTNYDSDGISYAPEAIILDAHDGTSVIKMLLGAIKFACMNGCIAGDILFARSYRHYAQDVMAQLRLDMDDLDIHSDLLIQRIAKMREYRTTSVERMLLADTAIKERYGKRDEGFVADMRDIVLSIRRPEDDSTDMFTAMNVVQENILRGGGYYTNNNRVQRMRPISQVDRNLNINQALWQCAEDIMKKAA